MYTFCTHCHTACEVQTVALSRSRGTLRCQACGRDFDALPNLTPDLPDGLPLAPDRLDEARAAAQQAQGTLELDFSIAASNTGELPPRTDILVDVLVAHADFIEPHYAHSLPEEDITPTEVALENHDIDLEFEDSAPPLGEPVTEDEDVFGPNEIAQDLTDFDIDVDSLDTVTAPEILDAADLAPLHSEQGTPTPSFIAPPITPPTFEPTAQRRWPRWLAVAALALLLAGQCIVAEHQTLAADARWRPALERVCDGLGCSLPTWHDPAALNFMTRDVRPHPSAPDALLISASFRNDAPWAQHWPRLHLTLSDLDGQTLAQREFTPAQYLGMSARELSILPGQTASVTLEVRDPGKQAVAFEFDFR